MPPWATPSRSDRRGLTARADGNEPISRPPPRRRTPAEQTNPFFVPPRPALMLRRRNAPSRSIGPAYACRRNEAICAPHPTGECESGKRTHFVPPRPHAEEAQRAVSKHRRRTRLPSKRSHLRFPPHRRMRQARTDRLAVWGYYPIFAANARNIRDGGVSDQHATIVPAAAVNLEAIVYFTVVACLV